MAKTLRLGERVGDHPVLYGLFGISLALFLMVSVVAPTLLLLGTSSEMLLDILRGRPIQASDKWSRFLEDSAEVLGVAKYLVASSGATALMLAIAITASFIAERAKNLRHHRRRNHAQRILAKGGPRSRKEYYFLFPGACPACGSRDLVVSYELWSWARPVEYGVDGGSRRVENCAKCSQTLSPPSCEGWVPDWAPSETHQYPTRVHSPYLEPAQEDSIREAAFQ